MTSAKPLIAFTVEGRPVPQGSKQPFVPTYGNGEPVRRHKAGCPLGGGRATGCGCPIMVNQVDDQADRLHTWRETVGWYARMAYKGPLIDELLTASFVFFEPRPKAHYGTGRNERLLKDSAPACPRGAPDLHKLTRAVEDALTKVVYTDDSLIVSAFAAKRYCPRWDSQRVDITIRVMDTQTVAGLVSVGEVDVPSAEVEFRQLSLV
ncbi:MAG: RusA family crossover junction endodeoxyribonuclease [Thermoleophilaceae bacterium]|nr:RusA family crossover junction endodeoxyribonuclease [Thermoleophilaceae bacterium]